MLATRYWISSCELTVRSLLGSSLMHHVRIDRLHAGERVRKLLNFNRLTLPLFLFAFWFSLCPSQLCPPLSSCLLSGTMWLSTSVEKVEGGGGMLSFSTFFTSLIRLSFAVLFVLCAVNSNRNNFIRLIWVTWIKGFRRRNQIRPYEVLRGLYVFNAHMLFVLLISLAINLPKSNLYWQPVAELCTHSAFYSLYMVINWSPLCLKNTKR